MHERIFKVTLTFIISLLLLQTGCDLVLGPDLPTDLELEEIFRENRADFEKIVRMSDEDSSLSVIRYKFTVDRDKGSSTDTGELGISKERWQEYKSLFGKLGLEGGILRGDDGSVHFSAYSWGLATGGITKGYVYSKDETPKGNFTCSDDSLDVLDPEPKVFFSCRNLDSDWYLFVQR